MLVPTLCYCPDVWPFCVQFEYVPERMLTYRPEESIMEYRRYPMDEHTQQVRDAVLDVAEAVLEAQLRAVRSLRKADTPAKPKKEQGMSQLDMAYNILRNSSEPLHISTIIDAIALRYDIRI